MPEAPKRPLNAYVAFATTAWDKIKRENPGLSVRNASKQIGAEWRGLDEQKRQVRDSPVHFNNNLD